MKGFIICNLQLHYWDNKIKWGENEREDEIGGAYSTNGEKRKAYMLLVGKPEGKSLLGRPRRRWLDNIRMDLGMG
jgi:hypothetical protein